MMSDADPEEVPSITIKELKRQIEQARAFAIKEVIEKNIRGKSDHILGCEIEGIAGILDRRGNTEIADELKHIAARIK